MTLPVQVILNPEEFVQQPENGGFGPRKDFFDGRNGDFAKHRDELVNCVKSAVSLLNRSPHGTMGIVKVRMRPEAWAKSHRPHSSLFTKSLTPIVGGADLGEILVEATPQSLSKIQLMIERTEEVPRQGLHPKTGEIRNMPSTARCETSAISGILLYGREDRRTFSVKTAVEWLSSSNTGGAYFLDIFANLLPTPDSDREFNEKEALLKSFVNGMREFGRGISIEQLTQEDAIHRLYSLRISTSLADPQINLLQGRIGVEKQEELAPFNVNVDRHAQILEFLDEHPLVRCVKLPPAISSPPNRFTPSESTPVETLLEPKTSEASESPQASYPAIGVIDTGISPLLNPWIIGRWDLLDPSDIQDSHGTFIGGIIVHGQALNGPSICPEPDGAYLFDIPLLPGNSPYSDYYGASPVGFIDEVDNVIREVKANRGIRIFNFSLNWDHPVESDAYGYIADRLDSISVDNDVIIFISAGNCKPNDYRDEWPIDTFDALEIIARAQNDRIVEPAESIRNVTVGALNPPGVPGSIEYVPSCYTRRGPGLRSGGKPDLVHIGGSGNPVKGVGHGLISMQPDGVKYTACGTSFSTPLVAKTAASILHAIDGHVSRETLIALLLHNAKKPALLQSKNLRNVARDFVGFGMPVGAYDMLNGSEHQITLVFSHFIRENQEIVFNFTWPHQLVRTNGRCRGYARLTLVSSPPTNSRFGAELVRVNINAALQQEHTERDKTSWKGQLSEVYLPGRSGIPANERERIQHGYKWAPNKVFEAEMPRGVGNTSNWRLKISCLTRHGETMPDRGVSFSALLTIADNENQASVYNEMRAQLIAANVKLQDIQTATRHTRRV